MVDIELRAVAGVIVGLLPPSAGGNPIYAASPNKDLGDGVRKITAVQDILIVAAEAASLGVTAGTPEPK